MKNDWITVKLVEVKSNRAGIGARIKVTLTNSGKQMRHIYRTVSSGGSFGASPIEQHIGLGKSARISSLEIWWPASHSQQIFQHVGTNRFIEITEFAKDYKTLKRKTFQLGRTG